MKGRGCFTLAALELTFWAWKGVTVPKEVDSMICRACGSEERASEGYPCADCGRFICLICSLRGVTLCEACFERAGGGSQTGGGS